VPSDNGRPEEILTGFLDEQSTRRAGPWESWSIDGARCLSPMASAIPCGGLPRRP